VGQVELSVNSPYIPGADYEKTTKALMAARMRSLQRRQEALERTGLFSPQSAFAAIGKTHKFRRHQAFASFMNTWIRAQAQGRYDHAAYDCE
jgi:hypothetical protein